MDVDAQALQAGSYGEVKNPGVCQHARARAYWCFMDWMASTSKEIQGLTINFPFLHSLQTAELQAWIGNS